MLNSKNYQDPLSAMLSILNLKVAISVNAQFCGGWLLGHKTNEKSFHLISHGECILELNDKPLQYLSRGDLIIFMRKVHHTLKPSFNSSKEEERISPNQGIIASATGILCGSFAYENTKAESLMRALPDVLVIRNDSNVRRWVEPLINLIQLESQEHNLGSDLIIKKLTEALLIQAIRSFIKMGHFEVGILRLMADVKLSNAILAVQNAPEAPWTVERLAKECAMSRTAFATHFKNTSAWSPMEYVTWWRMQVAWSRLVDRETIYAVSSLVGYRSEAAFSRAFKKAFSIGPGEVRASKR
ncbi:AraC family transcriptional regulator [Vibrio agarivorans]|uniref:AraC family transcriptional regulator n=1 Tax=Vibrio agarivorans TaxID=153622 RepID=UPI0025B50DE0|nr:AraC family transcriptional regulator [Vibrio agarivorans]MDN3663238.1 AraC family transcriptional regulator [Vibrio agarivorans]